MPLEIGMWVCNADAPWDFRGAVNYVIDVDGFTSSYCEDEAKQWHTESGLFQLQSMGVSKPIDIVENEVIDLLQRYGEPGEFVLAGRGVGLIEWPMIQEHFPVIKEWLDPQLVLDISGVSYTMALAGLSEELEPHWGPIGMRAMHDAQRSFLEFRHYTEVFQVVPLKE